MHVRYRVLLEKGLREIEQTVALGERTQDSSSWISRAREAREEMQAALADEKAQIETMPFTEAEIATALDRLGKKSGFCAASLMRSMAIRCRVAPRGRRRGVACAPSSAAAALTQAGARASERPPLGRPAAGSVYPTLEVTIRFAWLFLVLVAGGDEPRALRLNMASLLLARPPVAK